MRDLEWSRFQLQEVAQLRFKAAQERSSSTAGDKAGQFQEIFQGVRYAHLAICCICECSQYAVRASKSAANHGNHALGSSRRPGECTRQAADPPRDDDLPLRDDAADRSPPQGWIQHHRARPRKCCYPCARAGGVGAAQSLHVYIAITLPLCVHSFTDPHRAI